MSRILQNDMVNDSIVSLLSRLTNKDTKESEYALAMYELGKAFGEILLPQINAATVALASTVEDADYLGRGIVEVLEREGKKVLLTVFWNKRFKPNEENQISIAPIVKEFHEPGYEKADTMIIIKSIISSSCVVRTNLTNLIEVANPEKIFVVAPVLLEGALAKLEKEFTQEISNKFKYLFFAVDTERTNEGIVIPGIGGDVYNRLGFKGQDAKNKFIPEIVKKRRLQYVQ